jgi:homogentisate 1,2-dioxygenase
MTMNINTSPDAISRSSVNIAPGYMSGFGNSFETEALPGALPIGRAAAMNAHGCIGYGRR